MISDEVFTDYAYYVSSRFEAINSHYIKLMGKQIREIGQLSPSNLHRLEQMAKMSANVQEINQMLASASMLTIDELKEVYRTSGMDLYGDASKFYIAKGVRQIPFENNVMIQNYMTAIDKLTSSTFQNIARTTSVQRKYQDMVDKCIESVMSGQSTYSAEIIRELKDLASTGMNVTYASGLNRRLDSAIRMNVLDGIRQVNNSIRSQVGQEFGADGIEISAHALCALDHVDVQGRQFALSDHEVTVNGITYPSYVQEIELADMRPISTYNCKHIEFPIVLGISEPAYSDEELQSYKQNSNEVINVPWGKDNEGNNLFRQFTKYECTQLLRKIETQMRYTKDEYMAMELQKDNPTAKAEMRKAEEKLYVLDKKYLNICDASGLKPQYSRAYVPYFSGKQVKPKPITIKPASVNRQIKGTFSTDYHVLKNNIDNTGRIAYNKVKPLKNGITQAEMISNIAGADLTDGSCASLGLAYIGQTLGYDVLDFRDGASRRWFSDKLNKVKLFRSMGVEPIVEDSMKSSIANGRRILEKMGKGKQYYLSVGRHAAIVRLNDNGVMQYLELQSEYENGWKNIDNVGYVLERRFGCSYSGKYYGTAYMTDIELFRGKAEFEDVLGYINTNADKQVKGVGGYAK